MGKKLSIAVAVAGLAVASMSIASDVRTIDVETVAVQDKQNKIERTVRENNATGTVFHGEPGRRKTFAVQGTNLIKIAQENPKFTYDAEGVPQSENIGSGHQTRLAILKFLTGAGLVIGGVIKAVGDD